MPVLRSTTHYHHKGRHRWIRLYSSWRNMKARIAGTRTTGRGGLPIWAGLECDFRDWHDFRAWALDNGYCRLYCSLDREKSSLGYVKANLRWVTVLQNSTYANKIGAAKRKKKAQELKDFAERMQIKLYPDEIAA